MESEHYDMDTTDSELQPMGDSPRTVRCRGKVEKWLPCVGVLMLIVDIALLIALLIHQKSDISPQASNNGLTSAQSSNKTTKQIEDYNCIYHTRPEFLESIPDDIDHLCKPLLIEEGTKKDWFPCPNTPQLFLPAYCMCDAKSQCINSSKDQYRKFNCTTCRDTMHCPCQNNGKCEDCPSRGHPSENKCICPHGTHGKYCTKINKRKCKLASKSDMFSSYAWCNNSNNNSCLVEFGKNTFKCDLSELLEHQRNCSDIDVIHGRNAFQVDKENPEKQKTSVMFPAKAILIVCIILTVGVLVIILLYIWLRRNAS